MRIDRFTFGSIRIDGETHAHDVVIDHGRIRKRKKKPSKPFRDAFGHTPLSVEEDIPWNCRRLVVGTGAEGGALDPSHPRGYPGTADRAERDERDLARDLLILRSPPLV